ncbi:hypothetical protein NMY22_g9724 [Coprinellus aureogranulatus]|nr:hypothetical protein NMY22_g9724 [Coprinellus aureogranulatus]
MLCPAGSLSPRIISDLDTRASTTSLAQDDNSTAELLFLCRSLYSGQATERHPATLFFYTSKSHFPSHHQSALLAFQTQSSSARSRETTPKHHGLRRSADERTQSLSQTSASLIPLAIRTLSRDAGPPVPGSAESKEREEVTKAGEEIAYKGAAGQEIDISQSTAACGYSAQPTFDPYELVLSLEPVNPDIAVRVSQDPEWPRWPVGAIVTPAITSSTSTVLNADSGNAIVSPLHHERPRQSQSIATRIIRATIVLSLHFATCEGAMVVAPVLRVPENGTDKGEVSLQTPYNKAEVLGILGVVLGVSVILMMLIGLLAKARKDIERRSLGNRDEPHHSSSSHTLPTSIPLRDYGPLSASHSTHNHTTVISIGKAIGSNFGVNAGTISSTEYQHDGDPRSDVATYPPPPPPACHRFSYNAQSSDTLRPGSPPPSPPEPTELTPLGQGE